MNVDLYVGGSLGESVNDNNPLASASPTWDRELDFTGVDPVDGIVRTWRTGPCSYITLRSVDPCNTVGNPVQTGTITYKVYRESDKELITTITSDPSGKAIVFGLKDEEDYRVTASKPGCGTGVYKIVDLEYGEEYDVPLSCVYVAQIGCTSSCQPMIGPISGYEQFWWEAALPGVEITLVLGDHWITGTTGANGRFNFAPPAAGTWSVTAKHPTGRFRENYTVTTTQCGGGGFLYMTPKSGCSCCASGVIRSPIPIKLPILCVTDTGASWTQGVATASGGSCDGGYIGPVLVDRMGPRDPKKVGPCFIWPNGQEYCWWYKEPDDLAAGYIHMAINVGFHAYPATSVVPPASGSVSGTYGAAWNSTEWPTDEDCDTACLPGPKDMSGAAWWYSDPGITGGYQFNDRWELLSANPLVARVYFDSPPIASYHWQKYADGTTDGKAPLPRAIKYITVSEAG